MVSFLKKLFGGGTVQDTSQPQPAHSSDPCEQALTHYEATCAKLGAEHEDTAQALFGLTQALNSHRRFEEAEARGRQLLGLFEQQFGADHPNTGYALDAIANALVGQEKRKEGLEMRKTALKRLEDHFGSDHEMPLQRARLVAVDAAELGDLDEAKAVLEKYMPMAEKIPPLFAQYMDSHAFVSMKREGPQAAIPILESLIGFYREHGQTDTPTFASKLFNLAQMYDAAGQKDDALNASSEAGITALSTYGPDHPAAQDIFIFQTALREAKERGEF